VGYAPKQHEPKLTTSITFAGPEFFEMMGIPLIRGRGIESDDGFPVGPPASPKPVGEAVINESIVRRFFGNKDPIGREIHLPDDQTAALVGVKPLSYRIIGVVKDTVGQTLRDNNSFEIYIPWSEATQLNPNMPYGIFIDLRTTVDPGSLASSVRRVVDAIDPKMTDVYLKTMDDSIDQSLSQERMIARASGLFSLFALLLASLGLYGVLAYDVTQRQREIGVRMALGARSNNIIALILQQGIALTALGCAAGTIAALALAHLIASQLYGISALDPLTFIVAVTVLLAVSLLACWLPARRATKVDPMVALRAE
jgi:putative ABC transport system permease protein